MTSAVRKARRSRVTGVQVVRAVGAGAVVDPLPGEEHARLACPTAAQRHLGRRLLERPLHERWGHADEVIIAHQGVTAAEQFERRFVVHTDPCPAQDLEGQRCVSPRTQPCQTCLAEA